MYEAHLRAVDSLLRNMPVIRTGMANDTSVDAYSPLDVQVTARSAPMTGLMVAAGLSAEEMQFTNPTLFIDQGPRPMVLGRSPYRTTAP